MEFIQVIIFILVIIAVLYRNIQKENEKARKRNIAQPAPAKTFSPDEDTYSEDTEIPTTYPEYDNKQITSDCPLQTTTTNSSIQNQCYPKKKYRAEKAQNKEKEKYRNKKDTTSTNIKLTTAEEARRAFIYSEIFNRKY